MRPLHQLIVIVLLFVPSCSNGPDEAPQARCFLGAREPDGGFGDADVRILWVGGCVFANGAAAMDADGNPYVPVCGNPEIADHLRRVIVSPEESGLVATCNRAGEEAVFGVTCSNDMIARCPDSAESPHCVAVRVQGYWTDGCDAAKATCIEHASEHFETHTPGSPSGFDGEYSFNRSFDNWSAYVCRVP